MLNTVQIDQLKQYTFSQRVPKNHRQLVYGENRDTDRSLMHKTVDL